MQSAPGMFEYKCCNYCTTSRDHAVHRQCASTGGPLPSSKTVLHIDAHEMKSYPLLWSYLASREIKEENWFS